MSRQLYRTLVEESTDITTIIDTTGVITYVSPSVTGTLGYEPEDLVGENGFEYQHPDDREAVETAIEEVRADPDERAVIETRFRRADASWCWLEVTMQNRIDEEPIDGILVSSRDISQRKGRERQYQQLGDEYRTLLETVEDGIFFVDVESTDAGYVFRFERLNQSYEQQTDISTEAVKGKTPTEVFGEDVGSGLESKYKRCVRARESITYQEEVPVGTGAHLWQTNLAPVITAGDVSRIIGITRNVTERVEREQQLRRQKDRLDEFVGVVSHDLRSPLSVAQGRAELLAEDYDNEHLDHIVRSLDRMEEVISDTLTLARQGAIVAEPEPIGLTDLIGTCWRSVSTRQASIEIEDEVTIHGDRSRLQHVFENLFRNAIEHGGSDVTIRVGRIGDRGVYFEDTGPGIPEVDRDAVFEPGRTSADGGTGLGLTIVQRFAEAHGWTVDITEGPAGGARFEFTGVTIRAE